MLAVFAASLPMYMTDSLLKLLLVFRIYGYLSNFCLLFLGFLFLELLLVYDVLGDSLDNAFLGYQEIIFALFTRQMIALFAQVSRLVLHFILLLAL